MDVEVDRGSTLEAWSSMRRLIPADPHWLVLARLWRLTTMRWRCRASGGRGSQSRHPTTIWWNIGSISHPLVLPLLLARTMRTSVCASRLTRGPSRGQTSPTRPGCPTRPSGRRSQRGSTVPSCQVLRHLLFQLLHHLGLAGSLP